MHSDSGYVPCSAKKFQEIILAQSLRAKQCFAPSEPGVQQQHTQPPLNVRTQIPEAGPPTASAAAAAAAAVSPEGFVFIRNVSQAPHLVSDCISEEPEDMHVAGQGVCLQTVHTAVAEGGTGGDRGIRT